MIPSKFSNRGHAIRSGRQPNMGVVGWGLLGLGGAAAGTAGYLAWRNQQLAQACLGEGDWLMPDGTLTEEARQLLDPAIMEAIAAGATTAEDAAETAIVAISMDEGCRLPMVIWGDLARLRDQATAMASVLLVGPSMGGGVGPGGQGPGAGMGGGEAPPPVGDTDDWGEPTQNVVVDSGTVAGSDGGLWRVYQDNLGEFDRAHYFKVWRKGKYTEIGSFDTPAQAKQAAIDWILAQPKQAGVLGNPTAVPRHFPMQMQFNPRASRPIRVPALRRSAPFMGFPSKR